MNARRGGGRHTTTLVLVALAAAAGGWLYFAERSRVTSEEREARHGRLFAAWRGDDVSRVTLVSSRGSFSLERDRAEGGELHPFTLVTGGARAPSEAPSVDALLSTLELATVRREVPASAVDRSAMGLDAPRVRVEIAMGELRVHVAFGNDAVPASDGVYAEVDGERVVVVASAILAAVDVGPEALREKKVVAAATTELTDITLAGADGATRFVRGTWPASRGTGFRLGESGPRVDARAFGPLVDALGDLEADALVDGEASPEAARVVETLTPKSGAPVVFALGAACPGHADLVLVARRAPTRVAGCAASNVVAPFLRPAAAFEDHHVIGATRDELVEVKVVRDGEVLEMARRGTGFFVRHPAEQTVPDEAARGFIDALLDARGDLEAAPREALEGPGAATLRVISRPVADGDPERIEEVKIGPARDGKRAVRREEDGAGLWVADAALRPLLAGALVLRDRHVIDVASEKVREVAVLEGELSQRVRRVGPGVELVEPRGPGLVADAEWGAALLDRAAQLQAMRWIAATDDGTFGLAPPRATLEIHVEDELGKPESERTVRVALGARGDDGVFAQVVGQPEVFLAPSELEAAALRPLVDRGAFSVRPGDVRKLTVRAGTGAPFELEKQGAALVASAGPGDAGAQARAAKIREGLDDLVALTAVTVGEPKKAQGLDAPTLTLDVTPNEGRPFRVVIGASDVIDGASVHYARRSDVAATFAVAPSGVRALVEALR